jgi:hypothetical protein
MEGRLQFMARLKIQLDLGTPLEIKKKIPEADYQAIRHILKELAADRKYFAYCKEDDTLIWHQGLNGPWNRDDDGSYFLELASAQASPREAVLALAYFKHSCVSSHIDATLRVKRLAQRKEGNTIL